MPFNPGRRRVGVIGAGLSGLTAAYRLRAVGYEVAVFEASDQPGGRARSLHRDGYIIDIGASGLADSYTSYIALAQELGLGEELAQQSTKVGIVRDDTVHILDMDNLIRSGLSTRFLSLSSKLKLTRLGLDIARAKMRGQLDYADLRNAAPLDVETAGDYAARRLNAEVGHYLVGPVIRTMLITDADKVSKVELFSGVANIFTSKIMALKGGVGRLPTLLAEQVKPRYNCPVTNVRKVPAGVEVSFRDERDALVSETFEAVVMACPLPVATALCGEDEPALARLGAQLSYAPSITVAVGLKRAPKSPAFLIMMPTNEDPDIALVFLDHNKAPDRAPAGKGLLDFHWESGAAGRMANVPDTTIIERTLETCRRLFPDAADDVEFVHVTRWKEALPLTRAGAYRAIGTFSQEMDVASRIQFAGDYMSAAGQNTAVEMGNRAALRIQHILDEQT